MRIFRKHFAGKVSPLSQSLDVLPEQQADLIIRWRSRDRNRAKDVEVPVDDSSCTSSLADSVTSLNVKDFLVWFAFKLQSDALADVLEEFELSWFSINTCPRFHFQLLSAVGDEIRPVRFCKFLPSLQFRIKEIR